MCVLYLKQIFVGPHLKVGDVKLLFSFTKVKKYYLRKGFKRLLLFIAVLAILNDPIIKVI